MIGFSSLSNAAGMACLTLAAESQLNGPLTERQSASNLFDPRTSDPQSEISNRAKPSCALQASEAPPETGYSDLSGGQCEQTKQGILKVVARRIHEIAAEIYGYVPGTALRRK